MAKTAAQPGYPARAGFVRAGVAQRRHLDSNRPFCLPPLSLVYVTCALAQIPRPRYLWCARRGIFVAHQLPS